MPAVNLLVRVFLQMVFHLLADFITEELLKLRGCRLPLPVNRVDLTVCIF